MSETERKDGYVAKANEFLAKAKTENDEKAANTYRNAGTFFKMAGKWKEAGDAYHECAKLHYKEGNVSDAANIFDDAGECYLKSNDSIEQGKDSYTESIQLYQDMLNFLMASYTAGKYGEILENISDYKGALHAYQWGNDINNKKDKDIIRNRYQNEIDRVKIKLMD